MTVRQGNGPKIFYIGLILSPRARKWFVYQRARKGSFFDYVEKSRQVGGTGNVNGMQMLVITVKKLVHNLGIGKCSILDKIWINIVKEWPLTQTLSDPKGIGGMQNFWEFFLLRIRSTMYV